MNREGVNLAALAADETLIAKIRAANTLGQLGTELDRLLVGWRLACRTTGSEQQCGSCDIE